MKTGKTFDIIAGHFDKTRRRPWKEVVDFLRTGHGKLLDMGCGNGRHLVPALGMGYKIIGLDASVELLLISKRNIFGRVELIRGDVNELPFSKGSFDTVIYIATIHHLRKGRIESLKEARRVMKDGGRILVSAWAREQDRWELEEDERDVIVPWHHENGRVLERYYHLYTLGELEEDMLKAGFRVMRAFNSNGNNYVEGKR